MKVEVAASAGFCFGVSRAVQMIDELLARGEKVCTLGPLIHNPRFVEALAARGAVPVSGVEQVPEGCTVAIRSHGVPRQVYEELAAAGKPYVDATCPYVAKIQRLAQLHAAQGEEVLIAGDPDHPEVVGIRSHCEGASHVFRNLAELETCTRQNPNLAEKPVIVVAQTTFHAAEWVNCRNFIKRVYTKAIIFDTICSATSIRQQNAQELAGRCDAMVIVGGRESSNTQKLLAVCEAYCPSFLVEGADELPVDRLRHARRVGVTAGASTPACIIEEVVNSMTGLDNIDNEDIDFAAALEQSFKMLSTDEKVRGLVVGISPNEIQVDLGTKHAGYVPISELTDDSSLKPEQIVKVGDEIDLVVLRVNDQDGTVMLSKKRVDALKNWDEIVAAGDDNVTLTGVVTDVIKGGVLASVKGVKVFIPASQTGVPRNGDMNALLRQTIQLKIIEVNTGRRRAVGSIRAVAKEARAVLEEQFWNEVEVGREYTGKVKSLTSYGAFVDLGGVDGMIHISELSWSRIRHPSEVVNVGDTVNVVVKDLNRETKKVSLSYKDRGENPWDVFKKQFSVGDTVEAKIVSFMPFGAFAQIIPGVDGLIHISQISTKHVAKPQDELEMGQVVHAKIIEVEDERKRISLSIREAESAEGESYEEESAADAETDEN